jgi:transcriptional regulator with XRE-family HTH domain
MPTAAERAACGAMLRHWRHQRRLSQLALSMQTGVSTRHLSCLETGKAAASRQVLLHLAAALDMPLRERNLLLVAAGFAPTYSTSSLTPSDPAPAMRAFERVLASHEPFPAVVIDRQWNVVRANDAARRLTGLAVDPDRLRPNALRLALHPDGLATRIMNLAAWSGHLLARLRRQLTMTPDPDLAALYDEIRQYPGVSEVPPEEDASGAPVVVLGIRAGTARLRLLNTVTVFAAPLDTTLSELVLEAFHAADDETARALQENARRS